MVLIWVTINQLLKLVKNNIQLKTKDHYYRSSINTGLLLDIIKKSHNISNIGFYVTKRFKSWQCQSLHLKV